MNSPSKGGEANTTLQFPFQTPFTLLPTLLQVSRPRWVYILVASIITS